MHSLLRRPVALWRRHPLGLGLAVGLVAVLILGLGAGLAVVRLRSAHAATTDVTDCSQFGHAGDAGGTLYDALENPPPSSGDIIQFTCSGTITIPASQDAFTAPISVASTLAFNATGQSVTLDGGGAVQVFKVASTGQLTLEHLTVAHGSASHGGGLEDDGGTVTITDSTFSDNQANALVPFPEDEGGGLWATGGTVTITGSTFSGNQAIGLPNTFGGGLWATGGTVTITGSTFSTNASSGAHTSGGGLSFDHFIPGGSLTITGSTFSDNQANGPDGAFGGGLDCGGGTVTITASTFSGNVADSGSGPVGGGGISCGVATLAITNSTVSGNSVTSAAPPPQAVTGGGLSTGATTTITASTITDNHATDTFSPSPASGGGLVTSGTTTIDDSIVAANSADSGAPNCSGMPTDHGYNLEDSGVDPSADCGFSSASNDKLVATVADLHLGALGIHGGPTQTVPLQANSPAIDAIPPGTNGCGTTLTADQRGVGRPQGAGCDIGAFEFALPSAALAVGSPQYTAGGITYVTGATPLTLTGSPGEAGVASVSYCIYPQGGSCMGGFTTVAGTSATFTLTTGRADGPYTVASYATDTLGHNGATKTTALTLDDTAPATTLTVGQPQAPGSDGIVEVNSTTPLTLGATDGGAGVASVSYRFFPQGAAAPAFTTAGASSTTFHLTGADGVYEVDYDAADHLGNDPAHTVLLRLANATLVNGADVAAGQSGGAPPPGANGGPIGSQQGGSSTSGNSAGSNPAPAQAPGTHPAARSSSGGLPLWLEVTLAVLLALLAIGGGSFVLVRTQRNRQS